jgi:hypothetical protein
VFDASGSILLATYVPISSSGVCVRERAGGATSSARYAACRSFSAGAWPVVIMTRHIKR